MADEQKGVELRVWLSVYVRANGGTSKTAKMLGVHGNVLDDVLTGKRAKLPAFVLKKLGLRQVVTLMPLDATE